MHFIDWIVIVIYIGGVVVLGWYLGRHQVNLRDYFLSSKNLPWWSVGLSTMATQLGAISFISAPAFVGLKSKGGLIWLGYEFAVPFAMIILIWKVIPLFHKSGVISIYEYLEVRFDGKTRKFVSIIFLLSRGLATGVSIYATAIVISIVLNIPIFLTIVIIGVVAILYDYMGGIKAVVISDVIQMGLIFIGIIICIIFGLHYIGGWDAVLQYTSYDRIVAVDFNELGFKGEGDFGFLPLLFGGFFLYTSYYGFDQSQVQRELSARSLLDSRKSLILNAIIRYPIVLSYCILGLIVGAFALKSPEFMSFIPQDKVDYMIPAFVVHYLPAGISGLIIIAILAASMSSLDSALNSLSASTIEDILKPTILKNVNEKILFKISKLITLFWGIFCTGFAFLSGRISETIIESINMIGSVFYGPIAGIFFLGIFIKRSSSRDVIIGGLTGVFFNFILAFYFTQISWLWWNATGFIVSFALGGMLSLFNKKKSYEKIFILQFNEKFSLNWLFIYGFLIIYGVSIIIFSVYLKKIIF
ncbi:MAG: sodium/solute symporter [Thermodesulfobacteriota bacterium]|nr:sodium/solute symporter [Thermodesulfobacteriota bacterium]